VVAIPHSLGDMEHFVLQVRDRITNCRMIVMTQMTASNCQSDSI